MMWYIFIKSIHFLQMENFPGNPVVMIKATFLVKKEAQNFNLIDSPDRVCRLIQEDQS